jgi:hypothetical protein
VTLAPTPAEVMIAAAAREIRDGEVVFVGMRLPLLAFALAKRTHAPSAVGLFENGIIRETPSSAMLHTMGDTPNIEGARMCCRMTTVMGLLQRGDVDLGFLGGAEVDRFGPAPGPAGAHVSDCRAADRARSSPIGRRSALPPQPVKRSWQPCTRGSPRKRSPHRLAGIFR